MLDSGIGNNRKSLRSFRGQVSAHKNADFYLEEALRNQTHDEIIRFLYRNFEFSENVTDDRKYMLLALENSNPDITRLYLDNCGEK